jgi:uncharacterized protein YaaQ
MASALPTKLAISIVQIEDVGNLVQRLIANDYGATRIDAAGGFLRKESAVVLTATTEDRLPQYYENVRTTCRRRVVIWFPPVTDGLIGMPLDAMEVEVGGAVIFVLPIERIEFLNILGAGREMGSARAEVKNETTAVHS